MRWWVLVALPVVIALLMKWKESLAKHGDAPSAAWYLVDTDLMEGNFSGSGSEKVWAAAHRLASTFFESELDEATEAFIDRCKADTQDRLEYWTLYFKGVAYVMVQRWLAYSRTDASALLSYKTMHVASAAQFQALLGAASWSRAGTQDAMLDIGAGDGGVTARLAEAGGLRPEEVVALETSRPRLQRLAERGYRAVSSLAELEEAGTFGIVALFNVLDRCDSPRQLLDSALKQVRPGGVLLVAIVIPFCAKVHEGQWMRTNRGRPPKDALQIHPDAACKSAGGLVKQRTKPSFELAAAAFIAAVTEGLSVTVRSWTKVPYLSSGTVHTTHHVLDNALFVLQPATAGET